MGGDRSGSRLAVYHDREALSLAAARLIAEEARRAAEARDRFDLLLSGGETPGRTYQLLGEEPIRSTVPWQAVQVFWGDERYCPHDHPLSNFGMVRRLLLERVPLAEAQIHPVPYDKNPHESARKYQRLLQGYFHGSSPRFDLVLLGLGEDGHTASLFPGTAVLKEQSRWVCEVYVAEQDIYRITVTAPLVNQARTVAFLVSGSAKAAILHQVLHGMYDPQQIPAQLIFPSEGRLLWLADRDAACLLPEGNSAINERVVIF